MDYKTALRYILENYFDGDKDVCAVTDGDEEVMAMKCAVEALEKQIPKKPTLVEEKFLGEKIKAPHCPNCGDSWNCNEFGNAMKFCWECGQAIDWRE